MRAIDLMWALKLEDGRRWGEAATAHQKADAEAVLSPDKPNLHYITRPRGGSKTTDTSGFVVSWLACEAPRMSRGRVVAANTEQAAILIDSASAFIDRTPELQGVLEVENERILNPATGAWVRVLSQSDSGSWGLRNVHWIVADELAQWPSARGARRVWSALRSTVPKVPGCRLVVLTSAGEPSHWSHEIYLAAKTDPLWRVSEMAGPVPWLDPAELAALERELTPSEYCRLVLNQWSEGEDRPITAEQYEAAAEAAWRVGHGWRLREPVEGTRYSAFLDIGLVHDATAVAVAHSEPLTGEKSGPRRVVIDHLERRVGSRKRPVQLAELEAWLAETASYYNRAEIWADPSQAQQLIQGLSLRGFRAKPYDFTSSSVAEIAQALINAFRNGQIAVPDNRPLRDELLAVRLRETALGGARLDHAAGQHDDQAVVLAMACAKLLGTRITSTQALVQHWQSTLAANADPNTAQSRELREFQRGARQIMSRRARFGGSEPRRAGQCQHFWRVMADGRHVCVSGGPGGGGGCGAIREEIS